MTRAAGYVAQSALQNPRDRTGSTSFTALIEAVVVFIHYPDDSTNRSKVEVEYDLDVTSMFGLGRLRNVPRVDIAAGVDDGDDNILRCADAAVGSGTFVADGDSKSRNKPTPRYETTGDRVLVGFVNGNPNRPVIVGVLTHFNSRLHKKGEPLKDVKGKALPKGNKLIRRTRHRGTEMVLDDKGNVVVNFAKLPDIDGNETKDEKKLTINIGEFEIRIDNTSSPTTCEFKVKDGGTMLKFSKDGFEVGPSGQPMVLGTKLTDLLKKILKNYNAHQHTGNFGAPTPLIPDELVSEQVDIISDWAKVSKAKP